MSNRSAYRRFDRPGPARFARALLMLAALLAVPAAPALSADHVVRVISDYDNLRMAFEPKTIEIAPGDSVTWVNMAEEQHNMLTFPDGYPRGADGFISPDLTKEGERWTHTFTVAGTYEYHCLPHLPMGMRGRVVVGAPTGENGFHRPNRKQVLAYVERLMEYFDEDEYRYQPRGKRDD